MVENEEGQGVGVGWLEDVVGSKLSLSLRQFGEC